MRKVESTYENPLDNILYYISEYTSPYAYSLNLTPNILTTISIIFVVICVYLLLNKRYYLASLMYLIAYYFDCMDGFFARKYKMYSKFGDYYDHISDIFKNISVLYTLYYINSKKFFYYIPIIILSTILYNIHLGCQEIYYGKNESETLSILKKICPIKNKEDKQSAANVMIYTRFFASGTNILLMMIFIIYYAI
jgi:phosphatidylglycerophosphate synthase